RRKRRRSAGGGLCGGRPNRFPERLLPARHWLARIAAGKRRTAACGGRKLMGPILKLLTGLGAVLLLGWINYGPLGHGKLFIDSLEARARQVIAETNLTNIDVRLDRRPLRRAATLSGPADDFQRNGMGSFEGLTARVGD